MGFNQSFFREHLKKSAITGAITGAAGFGAAFYFAPAMIAPLATTIASYMPAALGLAASMARGFALTALAAIAAAVIAAIATLAIRACFVPKASSILGDDGAARDELLGESLDLKEPQAAAGSHVSP